MEGLLRRWVCLVLFIVISPRLCPANSAGTEAVLRVVLNQQVKGDFVVVITEDGDVLVTEDFLEGIGLRRPFSAEERMGLLSLRSIRGLSFRVDEEEAVLRITAEPGLLETSRVAIKGRGQIQRVEYLRDNALYLNYYLRYNADDRLKEGSLNGNLETALRWGKLLLYSGLSYTRSETEERLLRLSSNVTIDRPGHLQRLVIGDFSATSGGPGSRVLLGGIKIERNFSLNPYMIRYPGLGVEGVLETPSTVEVYLNGALLQRLELPPGPFRIEDLPATPGTGRIRLLIRDALGRETVMERPFYIPSRMLGQGISEYSLALGFRREEPGEENFHYGRPALLGFVREGLTDHLTMGLRAEADQETVNGGVEATISLLSKAEMSLSGDLSQRDGQTGFGGSMGVNIPTQKGISLGLILRGFSEEYADLLATERPALNWAVRAGLGIGHLGGVSAVYSLSKDHQGSRTRDFSIHYSRTLWRRGSLFLTAKRQWSPSGREDSLTFGILMPLGRNHHTSLQHTVRDGQAFSTLSLYRNPPRGPGAGYRLQVNRQEDGATEDWRGYGRVEYHHRSGHLIAEYQKTDDTGTLGIGLRGAVVVAGGGIYPSAPIHDGFAIVDTGLEGVKVRLNGQFMGETPGSGRLVVPGLVSYYDNPISISSRDLPVEYSLKESTKHVSPYYRSGGVVRFEIERFRAVEGRIYWIEKGRRVPAEFAGLEVTAEGRTIQTVTGEKGFFYIEGLGSGEYPARVFKEGRECRFTLAVPESLEVFLKVGEISCGQGQ